MLYKYLSKLNCKINVDMMEKPEFLCKQHALLQMVGIQELLWPRTNHTCPKE